MLILAATPIGNLGDASRRLVEALEAATVIAAEDTRTTQRLLAGLGIDEPAAPDRAARPQREGARRRDRRARADQDVLVLSDAGMPTVNDPGFGLVAAAAARGCRGDRAARSERCVTALAVAGLPTDRFTFEGFPARKPGDRRAAFAALAPEPRTMVFFEAPSRSPRPSTTWPEPSAPIARAAVCRELTKLYEEVKRGGARRPRRRGPRKACAASVVDRRGRCQSREPSAVPRRRHPGARAGAPRARASRMPPPSAAAPATPSRELYQAAAGPSSA